MEEYNKIERYNDERKQFFIKLNDMCNGNDIITNFFIRLNSPKSMETYLIVIDSFIKYMHNLGVFDKLLNNIDEHALSNVTSSHVIMFFDELSKDHSLSSVNTYINMLSSFFSYMNDNYGIDNPVKRIPKSKYKTKRFSSESKYPENELIDDMINNISNTKDEFLRARNLAIVEMLKGSGMRINELTDLNVDNIHLNDNEMPYVDVIRKGYYNNESHEKIYLADSCIQSLNEWLDLRKNESINADALFCSNDEKRIKPNTIRKMMKKNSDGRVLPHMLRHYFATDVYNKTKDIAFVKSLMGHSYNSNVTEAVYINTKTEDNLSILKQM